MNKIFNSIFGNNRVRSILPLSKEMLIHAKNIINAYERISNEDYFILDFVKCDIVHVSKGLRQSFVLPEPAMEDNDSHLFNKYVSLFPKEDLAIYGDRFSFFIKLFYSQPKEERTDLVLSIHHHLLLKEERVLVHERITPLICNSDGNLWLALCSLTGSAEKNLPHAEFLKGRGYETVAFSEDRNRWKLVAEEPLTHREHMTLSLAGQGYTMTEQANMMSVSTDAIKKYRISAIRKLGASNLTNALCKAYDMGIM